MTPRDFELTAPSSLTHALELLASGDYRPFCGGTDLMVLMHAGRLSWRQFVSLWRLPELRGVTVGETQVRIGAGTTFSELQKHQVIPDEFPMLAAAARELGSVANQNRATLGGNIANASPAADAPPALLAYDAELELQSAAGMRTIPDHQFHTGYKQMHLAPGEIISAVLIPRKFAGWRHMYRKVGTRAAQAISKICIAAGISPNGEYRVAMASVAPIPLRCQATERALAAGSGLAAALASDIQPIDDLRSTAAYRRTVALNLLQRFRT